MKPRILYVVRYFPTLTETFVHNEATGLHQQGIQVNLASFGSRGDPHTRKPDFPVYTCPHRWGWLPWLPAMLGELLRNGPASRRVLWLSALIRKLAIQRIHVHFAGEAAEWALAASQRLGIPFGLTTHAVDLFRERPTLAGLLRSASPLVTISQFNQHYISEKYQLHAELVPCGVAPLHIPTAPTSPPEILAVGRWVAKKGFPDLLKAWEILAPPHATLHLISTPPPDQLIPAQVVVHGPLSHPDVLVRMSRATALVLPCIDARAGNKPDMDGIPVVILEAMAAGIPVITTPISGIPEVVDEEVGWLVPPAQPTLLAQAIQAVLANPAEAARRGAAAKARILQQGRTLDQQIARMARLVVEDRPVVG